MLLDRAERFAAMAHAGQTRVGGAPYITHPAAVVEILKSVGERRPYILAAAWLHDVLEDCAVDYETVCAVAGPRVGALVVGLTKRRGLPEARYLRRIFDSPDLTRVKLADRIHNASEVLAKGRPAAWSYLTDTLRTFRDVKYEPDLQAMLLETIWQGLAKLNGESVSGEGMVDAYAVYRS